MDALFPIKSSIPDDIGFDTSINPLVNILKRSVSYSIFLLSSEENINEKNVGISNKIYYLGEIKKDGKNISIYYIIVPNEYNSENLKIKICFPKAKDSVFIQIDKANLYDNRRNFLFNLSLVDKENKKFRKLNCLDIYEEFEIFYRIHSENKNRESLKSLRSSIINIFKDIKREESNFSFLLKVFMKEQLHFDENIFQILKNIKNIGDLSKIPKDDLYKFTFSKENEKYRELYIIYAILSKNKEELEKIIYIDNNIRQLIFKCLEKYNLLFSNSLQLYPGYIFLTDISNSFQDIEIILKCSNSLNDFILFINKKKECILNFIEKNHVIFVNKFFDLKKELEKKFDEEFYFELNSIKEFENKNNKILIRLFDVKDKKKFKLNKKLFISYPITFIKSLIILYQEEEYEEFPHIILNDEFLEKCIIYCEYMNNFEIISIIAMLIDRLYNNNLEKNKRSYYN